jgi:hypothetical protein
MIDKLEAFNIYQEIKEDALKKLEGKEVEKDIGFFWVKKRNWAYIGFLGVVKDDVFLMNPNAIGGGYADPMLQGIPIERYCGSFCRTEDIAKYPSLFCEHKCEHFDDVLLSLQNRENIGHSYLHARNYSFSKMVRRIIDRCFNKPPHSLFSASPEKKIKLNIPGIYCLRQGDFIKVGKSNSNVNQRAKSQCVAGISKAFVIEHKNADWLESICHDWMRKNMNHERGEWFRCNGKTDAEVFEFANAMLNKK